MVVIAGVAFTIQVAATLLLCWDLLFRLDVKRFGIWFSAAIVFGFATALAAVSGIR